MDNQNNETAAKTNAEVQPEQQTTQEQPSSPEVKQEEKAAVQENKAQELNPEQPPVTKDEKIYGAIGYVPFIQLVSILFLPDSAYVRMHVRQGIMLFALSFLAMFFLTFMGLVGLGTFAGILASLVFIAYLAILGYSAYQVINGVWWKIPMIGQMSEIIPIELIAKTAKENAAGQIGEVKRDYDNRQDTLNAEAAEKKDSTATVTPDQPNVENAQPDPQQAETSTPSESSKVEASESAAPAAQPEAAPKQDDKPAK